MAVFDVDEAHRSLKAAANPAQNIAAAVNARGSAQD